MRAVDGLGTSGRAGSRGDNAGQHCRPRQDGGSGAGPSAHHSSANINCWARSKTRRGGCPQSSASGLPDDAHSQAGAVCRQDAYYLCEIYNDDDACALRRLPLGPFDGIDGLRAARGLHQDGDERDGDEDVICLLVKLVRQAAFGDLHWGMRRTAGSGHIGMKSIASLPPHTCKTILAPLEIGIPRGTLLKKGAGGERLRQGELGKLSAQDTNQHCRGLGAFFFFFGSRFQRDQSAGGRFQWTGWRPRQLAGGKRGL